LATETIDLPENVRIGVVADTHVYSKGARSLPRAVLDFLARADIDLIIHCGDIACQDVLDSLATIGRTVAVRGNNDAGDFGSALPEQIELTSAGRVIRVVHGDGGISARAVAKSLAPGAQVVIYGHSHIPMIEKHRESVLLNPGSPNDRRWHPHFGLALLEITPAAIYPELILFEDTRDLAGVTPGWRSNRK
jgi:putative phosphoesterase